MASGRAGILHERNYVPATTMIPGIDLLVGLPNLWKALVAADSSACHTPDVVTPPGRRLTHH